MVPSLRSLPVPEALGELIRSAYRLPVETCVLLRSLANDVYEVTASGQRYAVKVYGAGRWSADEVLWEQELAGHLFKSGIPVALVVPLADGQLAGSLSAPEGTRPFAMTRFVDGEKPKPPFDDVLYRDFGRLIARFHVAADAFASCQRRRPFDLALTLDRPLALVLPRLADQPSDQRMVRDLGAEARRRVNALAARGLEWGIRHGDVTLDNIHRASVGLVLHDFDLAGPGWRAADLTGVRATEHWDAFRGGYEQVRELRAVDREALPWLAVIESIANLRFHLVDKPTFRGTESVREGWVERELIHLREMARTLK